MPDTFIFSPDAFRDNERERARTRDVLDRLNAGDELSDLTMEEVERVVEATRHFEGANEATRHLHMIAQEHLDSESEKAHERSLSEYYGGGSPQTMDERHQAAWQEHQDAHRRTR